MTRVRQRRRFLYGKITLRVLLVDSVAAPITPQKRKLALAYTLDAVRLLMRLGSEWAWSQQPPVRHPICRFTLDWSPVTVLPLPAPPLTGNVDLDIAARELAFMPSLLDAMGLGIPFPPESAALRDALVDETDRLLDQPSFGRNPDDVVTLVITTLPTGWRAYASPQHGLAVVNWDDVYSGWYGIDHVIAHELAHLFGGLDEYVDPTQPSVCNPQALGGALRAPNRNCVAGGTTHQVCLMREAQPVLCDSSLLHVGWRDADGDEAMDLAQPPSITGMTQVDPSNPRVVNIKGPGTEFATRVVFNDTEQAESAFIDDVSGLVADIPAHMSGAITVDVTTVTGWTRGDPGVALVIL